MRRSHQPQGQDAEADDLTGDLAYENQLMRRTIIYENVQWQVTLAGVRCSTPHYFIRGDRLIKEWPCYSWHQRLGATGWCDIDLFNPAFRVAVYVFHRGQFTERMLCEMERRGYAAINRVVLW